MVVSETTIAVEIREGAGKGVARKLRAAGRVPAVLYGHGLASIRLSLDPSALEHVIKSSDAGLNTLIALEGDATIAGKTVLVKELQRDPVRGQMLHADLFEVDPRERITVSVPLQVVGTAPGVSLSGGLLDHSIREIELDCLPRAIPDTIEVDVSSLELGDSLHVRDLVLPEGVELKTDSDLSVISIVAPSVAEEAVAEAEEEELVEGAVPDAEQEKEAGAAPEGDESKKE